MATAHPIESTGALQRLIDNHYRRILPCLLGVSIVLSIIVYFVCSGEHPCCNVVAVKLNHTISDMKYTDVIGEYQGTNATKKPTEYEYVYDYKKHILKFTEHLGIWVVEEEVNSFSKLKSAECYAHCPDECSKNRWSYLQKDTDKFKESPSIQVECQPSTNSNGPMKAGCVVSIIFLVLSFLLFGGIGLFVWKRRDINGCREFYRKPNMNEQTSSASQEGGNSMPTDSPVEIILVQNETYDDPYAQPLMPSVDTTDFDPVNTSQQYWGEVEVLSHQEIEKKFPWKDYTILQVSGRTNERVICISEESSTTGQRLAYMQIYLPVERSHQKKQNNLDKATTLFSIEHPHIVKAIRPFYKCEEQMNSYLYVFMEVASDLRTLEFHIEELNQQKQITSQGNLKAMLHLFEQICHTVDYLHKYHYVNEYLNCSNILINTTLDDVKLSGSIINGANDTFKSEMLSTATKNMHALPDEYSKDKGTGEEWGKCRDVYHLGWILFEMTHSMGGTEEEKKRKLQEIRCLSQKNGIQELLFKMLTKDPDNQPTVDRIICDVKTLLSQMEKHLLNTC